MNLISKPVACLLLLIGMAPLFLTVEWFAAVPVAQTHAGSCHGGHRKVPGPASAPSPGPVAPVNYQCCKTGHNAAILLSASGFAPAFLYFSAVEQVSVAAVTRLDSLPRPPGLSTNPPLLSLRI